MGKLNQLLVSEIFYSLQGEGSTMGVPAVFLRLGGCNLFCDGAWRCDTIEVWRKGNKLSFGDVLPIPYLEKLKKGAHLVITGGEPLLQKEALVKYLEWFSTMFEFIPFIEIETNGTLTPSNELLLWVNQWNVSPKLGGSGIESSIRIKTHLLSFLNKYKTIFKFVISSQEDWEEIEDILLVTCVISKDNIWLMPAASNIKQLLETNHVVAKIALDNQVNFCTRLQVELWNKTVGV